MQVNVKQSQRSYFYGSKRKVIGGVPKRTPKPLTLSRAYALGLLKLKKV